MSLHMIKVTLEGTLADPGGGGRRMLLHMIKVTLDGNLADSGGGGTRAPPPYDRGPIILLCSKCLISSFVFARFPSDSFSTTFY